MKVTKEFAPITIVLETREDVVDFQHMLSQAKYSVCSVDMTIGEKQVLLYVNKLSSLLVK